MCYLEQGKIFLLWIHMAQQFRCNYRLQNGAAFNGDANGLEDLITGSIFQQVAIGPCLNGIDDAIIIIKSGKDNNTRTVRKLTEVMNSFDSIHYWHFQIEQKHIWL